MMRSLLLAACLVASGPLRAGQVAADAPAAADWRKAGLPDGAKDSLTAVGYRFEDDGRVLDPETKAPLSSEKLAAAVSRLSLSTQQLALERLRLILAKDKLDAADLRKLADMDLARISSYFDASRTLSERRDAAQPVRAGEPGRRVSLPYFNESDRRAGESLSVAASATISKDAFGRTVLARLDGKDGKPALPPIVISDLAGGNVAAYDHRRRALVMDRTNLLMSVTEDAAPQDRAALSKKLSTRQALVDYVAAHPESAASFAAKNDALLVHELTHAWQDRRDPVMREMARGNLPQAMLIEYEIEAWTTKNLYIHSRLKSDPGAKIDVFEMDDYLSMLNGYSGWARALRAQYTASSINTMDVATASAIQQSRIARVRARAAATNDEQTAKSLDLLALTRAERELSTMRAGQASRLHGLETETLTAGKESARILVEHYLAAAEAAPNAVEFSVNIQKAKDYAARTGDKELIGKVRACKERSR